jgi:crotonobetainyl-CoA:carnitine CoA-transferase CaiB-like acyl-CoA transferase
VSGIVELAAERFGTRASRVEHVHELEAILTKWMSTQSEAELYEFAQALLLPWAPVTTLQSCLDDPQTAARRFRKPNGSFRFPAIFTPAQSAGPAAKSPARTEISRRALEGVRVLDFGIAWAGALTGRQLGDLGADVIKIETRRRLDTRGSLVPVPTGIYVGDRASDEPWNRAATFVDRHRNKRSIAVELDRPEGVDVLRPTGVSPEKRHPD